MADEGRYAQTQIQKKRQRREREPLERITIVTLKTKINRWPVALQTLARATGFDHYKGCNIHPGFGLKLSPIKILPDWG